jgi:cystathionine beta-lyase
MDEETRLIRAGLHAEELARTVGPPIQKGSTVLLPNAAALYDDDAFVTYGRKGLASHAALTHALAQMEGAAGACLYPSGLAALTGAMLAVLEAGDQVLVADCIYNPTRRFCDKVLARYGVAVRYFDPEQSPEALVGEASDKVRLIVLESPGSLTFEMQDLSRIAELARQRGILTMADNTWGAGYLFKPLEHGIDISVQALTKYVGGHSDVFMGSACARDYRLFRRLDDGIMHLGWAVSPEDAYQMLRGLRTLPTRLERQGASALKVAAWLQAQDEVAEVLFPALPGARHHHLWKRDWRGACGLFSVVLKPASAHAVDALLDALSLFGLGFSWGGFESLAISCDPQLNKRRHRKDYGGPLVRFHVGLEHPDDLIADLRIGLDAYRIAAAAPAP